MSSCPAHCVPPSTPLVYVVCKNEETKTTLEQFVNFIQTLGQVGAVHLTFDPPPSGCTMATVGSNCEVHLLLKGMVDVGKEVTKIETKIGKLDGQLERLMKAMSIDNYQEKVYIYICIS